MRNKRYPDGIIPWDLIKSYYITGTTGLRYTATLFGVALSNLSIHAADEGWEEERERYRSTIGQGVFERIKEQAVDDGKRIYDAARAASANLIKAIEQAASDEDGFFKHTIQRETEETVSTGAGRDRRSTTERSKWVEVALFDVINGKNAADAARALKDLSGLARTLDGIMDAATKEQLAISRERLQVEKETKGAMARTDPNGVQTFGIVEIPSVDMTLLDQAEDDPAYDKTIEGGQP